MTSLQFTGELPAWIGGLLSVVVAVLSWRYYNSESFDLPKHLRWILPALRSLAFFLGIMLLTGPVLQHRKTIGELGRVQIYVDASSSMSLHDRQMPLGRKLRNVEALGWITPGTIDTTLIDAADELALASRELIENLGSMATPDAEPVTQAAAVFAQKLTATLPELTPNIASRMRSEVLEPLANIAGDSSVTTEQLTQLAGVCNELEAELRSEFEESLQVRLRAGDHSIESALTLFDETSRWRRAELGLDAGQGDLLAQLRQKHEVSLKQLKGEQAVELPLSFASESNGPELENEGDSFFSLTDLSSGIAANQQGVAASNNSDAGEATAIATGQPQTAIVLLTDGQHNAGPSPLQTARLLGKQGVAFYCVGMGATEPAADLALVSLEHPELAFAKDRIRGVMTIHDSVSPGKPFVAEIRYEDELLWQQQLLTQNVAERRVEFDFGIEELVDRLGAQFDSDVQMHVLPLQLTASISPLADESETGNNSRRMKLAAVLQSDSVLILDGRSRWETRYLRNAFERDDRWRVNTVVAGAGTDVESLPRGEHDGQFPPSREALFGYELVIFGEISPDLFSPHELQWLREFVEIRGGGLIFVDGQRGTLKQLSEQNLGSLLPVEWSDTPLAAKPSTLQLTPKGASNPALRLMAEETPNRRFWTELPAPHSLVPVKSLPGAETLVEAEVNGQPHPAMVWQRFGAGKVLYLAFDETWRWRYKAADTWHQRVWNQLAKFVMPKPFAVSDDFVSIDSGAISYAAGESVNLRVQLLGLDGLPNSSATVDALIWKDGEIVGTVGLTADENVPGMYTGRSASLGEGDYEVSVRAAGYSSTALKARSEFVVRPPETAEMNQTAVNIELLQEMANASGGVYLREEELSKLPELLEPLSSGRVVESTTVIWQSYWWFGAMVLLLSLEWLLRKRAGLL
ncbi:MAG: VWA domain-containing protein [Planctomycetaceae bacterium]|nr:VWA domain-containing protein [Planctomycetaceae bacterium]MCB9950077.1 VWA domain-containing protein [Planctomycetaceae bacterium]